MTDEMREWRARYGEMITVHGLPRAGKAPGEIFRRVLAVLAEKDPEEIFGWQLVDWLGHDGGAVYPVLRRMESYLLVVSREESERFHVNGRRRRVFYRLTDDGRELAAYALAAERS